MALSEQHTSLSKAHWWLITGHALTDNGEQRARAFLGLKRGKRKESCYSELSYNYRGAKKSLWRSDLFAYRGRTTSWPGKWTLLSGWIDMDAAKQMQMQTRGLNNPACRFGVVCSPFHATMDCLSWSWRCSGEGRAECHWVHPIGFIVI